MKWGIIALLAAGCGSVSDPCAGAVGDCLTVEVRGNVPKLDVLELSVSSLQAQTLTGQTNNLPNEITLPAQFAVLLPSPILSALLQIQVVGVHGGVPIASGFATVNVPPAKQRVKIELSAIAGDGGTIDLSRSIDLAAPPGSDLSAGSDLSLPPGTDLAAKDMATVPCVPTSCAQLGVSCGTPSDGCGKTLSCGPACQLGSFSAAGTLNPGLTGFGIAQTAKFVYLFGGQDSTTAIVSRIESAPINSNGTLGTFSATSGSLLSTRAALAANIIGNFVYVTGGVSGATDVPTVDRAPINSDGTLGAFVNAGVSLLTPRDFHVAVPIKGFFYVLGGRAFTTNTATASVERAQINPDGTLGAFGTSGSLTIPRTAPTLLLTNNFLYVIGGGTDGGTSDFTSIERATVDSNGNLGAFSDAGVELASARFHATTTLVGSDVYVIGGGDGVDGGGTFLNTVDHATVNGSGGLSSFAIFPGVQLMTGREDHGAVLTGSSLYVIGGFNGTDLTSIERAPLQ